MWCGQWVIPADACRAVVWLGVLTPNTGLCRLGLLLARQHGHEGHKDDADVLAPHAELELPQRLQEGPTLDVAHLQHEAWAGGSGHTVEGVVTLSLFLTSLFLTCSTGSPNRFPPPLHQLAPHPPLR